MSDQTYTPETLNALADKLRGHSGYHQGVREHAGAWKEQLDASQERVRKYDGLLRRTANMLRTAPPRERHILGIGGDGVTHWYIADQLLADIDEALIG